MTENLSQLGPVKFPDQVSVMVLTMTMFVDEMQLRHRGCLCQESSNLKLTRPCAWQLARNGLGRRLRKHKNVIDGAGVGLDDHAQSSYAPNSDAQVQDQVKEMLQWFRKAIPNLTKAGLIQYQMA